MVRDENSKVTFYADPDVKKNLDRLDSGTKSHTINAFIRKGFEGTSMYIPELHSFCSEFYTVEKTLELVVRQNNESVTVRLEALRNEESGKYSTRAYFQEAVTLQPTYPRSNGNFEREAEDFDVWVPYDDFPWTHRDTADEALGQALGFLRERCDVPARR